MGDLDLKKIRLPDLRAIVELRGYRAWESQPTQGEVALELVRRLEVALLRARVACQTLIAAVGSDGPENVEDAAVRAAARIAKLEAAAALHAEDLAAAFRANDEVVADRARAAAFTEVARIVCEALPDGGAARLEDRLRQMAETF